MAADVSSGAYSGRCARFVVTRNIEEGIKKVGGLFCSLPFLFPFFSPFFLFLFLKNAQ